MQWGIFPLDRRGASAYKSPFIAMATKKKSNNPSRIRMRIGSGRTRAIRGKLSAETAKKATVKQSTKKKVVVKKKIPVKQQAVAKTKASVKQKAVAKKKVPVKQKAVAKKKVPVKQKA
ncbi:MAG: hypothetical protein ACYYK0_06805, partial [Candidatus Eutrophobiaceae bacterium]